MRRRFERTPKTTSAEMLPPKHCYQATRCHIPINCNFLIHRHKNLKFHACFERTQSSLQFGIPARYDLFTRALLHCCHGSDQTNPTQGQIIILWYVTVRVANLKGDKSHLCNEMSGMTTLVLQNRTYVLLMTSQGDLSTLCHIPRRVTRGPASSRPGVRDVLGSTRTHLTEYLKLKKKYYFLININLF
jgi:hypothetical protein